MVRTALVLVVLAPASALFALVWQSATDDSSFANAERHGIEYLQSLVPLEIALTNAQSLAVAGAVPPREPLIRALDATSKVDDRLGDGLRTRDRWSELRTKIEALPSSGGQPTALYTAYDESTDLLLALADKVRTSSGLIRDPSGDAYYLEDGAAQELPEAIVAASQYAGLAVLSASRPASQQATTLAQLIGARDDLASNAQDLGDDIRLAVDNTGRRTLGGSLLTKVDQFSRSVQSLAPATALSKGRVPDFDPGQLSQLREAAQAAAADLSAALLTQIDDLLRGRVSGLDHRLALAVGLLALVTLAATAVVLLAGRALRRRVVSGQAGLRAPTDRPDPVRPAERPVTVPAAAWPVEQVNGGSPGWHHRAPDELADPEAARWEQYGATR